jgi:hypothetical protein
LVLSIAKSLPDVDPFFMQDCPMCGRSNRIVVQGVYIHDGKRQLYPDIGYSFCNCKAIFYTRPENIKQDTSWDGTVPSLAKHFEKENPLTLILPDPFFCDWHKDPYEFEHWNPRLHRIIWDMDTFCDEATYHGYEVLKAFRDMDVKSESPKTMQITLKAANVPLRVCIPGVSASQAVLDEREEGYKEGKP